MSILLDKDKKLPSNISKPLTFSDKLGSPLTSELNNVSYVAEDLYEKTYI